MTTAERLTARAEYRLDSPWVPTPRPRLSWVFETQQAGWRQLRAEIRTDDGHSATIDGEKNSFVEWPFTPLEPRQPVAAEVRLQNADGRWTDWSASVALRLALLPDGEWKAIFVGLRAPSEPAQPFVLRHTIELQNPPAAATLYWSALGAATARIDGITVDDSVLSPGWTSYPERVIHETTDVTALLSVPGRHTISLEVTGAWYTESYGFADEAHRVYGEQPSAAAQLHLLFQDGTEQIISSGEDWEADAAGAVVSSSIYDGDVIDHRRSDDHHASSSDPWPMAIAASAQPVPVPRIAEPVRRIEHLPVSQVLASASGNTILDFGQNLVGRLRVHVDGPAGTRITIRHAEVLENGELGVRPLRRAAATDTFVLAGTGPETFEPVGTFHGFRYAEVTGWPGELNPEDVSAVVLHSDMRRTGWFESSHPLINRLHENVVWGMRGNFLSLPTDCPQRDERLGWTGDVQIFAPTATTLFDCNGFLASWLTDLRGDQTRAGGVVPTVVPNVFGFAWPAAGWGDAATVVPSVMAERFGDADLLVESVESMRAWVATELEAAGGATLWESTLQFGDWLDPDAPADMAGAAKTAPGIVATAYLYRSLVLLAAAADAAGLADVRDQAADQAQQVRVAFINAYLTGDGRMMSDAPTAYALALQFGLAIDPELRRALASRLAHVTKRGAYLISTGFIGTPLILDALTENGHHDAAAALLLQTRAPSWLYPVTMGGTTVWERWDSLLPDGSINPGEMTSFNHYALGAVADWLYRRVAGVAPAAPGYSRIRFAPIALRGLDHASATIDTPSGTVRGGWQRIDGEIHWNLTVPAHSRAEIHIPDVSPAEVEPGSHQWTTTDQLPATAATVPTMWSPVAEVVDHLPAYNAMMDVLTAEDPSLAEQVRKRTDWTAKTPLAAALFSVPPHVTENITKAIADLAISPA
jgi:alpha-L-rhamnosidase